MNAVLATAAVSAVLTVLAGDAAAGVLSAPARSAALEAPRWAAPAPPESPVADAAMRSDLAAVRALVKQGADVNAAQGDGMTGLHWAAQRGDLPLVQLLVHAGASPRATTRNGHFSPLHLAAQAGHGAVVRALLEAGANPNAATTTGGATPLHFAVSSGSVESVAALLDGGAKVDARETAWEQTPLMWAAAYDHVPVIRLLLERGADASAVSKVEDIAAREKSDQEAEKRRNQRMAVLWNRSVDDAQRAGRNLPPVPTAKPQDETVKEEDLKPLTYGELVGRKGGLSPLHFAARQGSVESVRALLEAGADLNRMSEGDHTSPLLIATLNGHFDLAMEMLRRGADPRLASDAGTTPLYAALNLQWAPKAAYPQPTAYKQQTATYLELMEALLAAGADPNVRLEKHLWFMEYNFPQLDVDVRGATPFWRAAYAGDIDAMKLLVKHGADPGLPTRKPPARRRPGFFDDPNAPKGDLSGLPPVPTNGPGVYPIHAATGVGFGEGFAANSHRHTPGSWLPAVKYLVEELGADVNARDYNGYNAVHHAASRGDNELIRYLVEKGADVTAVSRKGQTTADMANGPAQRTQPYPATVKLLESLGAKNNHRCVSC